MSRTFKVPDFYKGTLITQIKKKRQYDDPKRKDLSPSILQFNGFKILLARHFGFCFGVENAIETAYRVIEENPGKRIFLLSEMIHNPQVNEDLEKRGLKFLMTTHGERLIDFSTLNPDDIVIVPAFGATLEILEELRSLGIEALKYNATCPFVEKVWKRSNELGSKGFTVIIHGKKQHEETKATFSRAKENAPSLIVKDLDEAKKACSLIKQLLLGNDFALELFNKTFKDNVSVGFNPLVHLTKIGVVNQTTMLASETITISNLFKETMIEIFGQDNISEHFADTKDTLCYATNENQNATKSLREENADLALVIGGYNSSNTSHLVELLEEKVPTYFIKDSASLIDSENIEYFSLHENNIIKFSKWIPQKESELVIQITAGASCPDVVIEKVIERLQELIN